MTLPTLNTLASGDVIHALFVLQNDERLRDTFGALDIASNINQIYSPMIIGPVRCHFRGTSSIEDDHLVVWKTPTGSQNFATLLRELHVSVLPSTGTATQDISGTKYIVLKVETTSDVSTSIGSGTQYMVTVFNKTVYAKPD